MIRPIQKKIRWLTKLLSLKLPTYQRLRFHVSKALTEARQEGTWGCLVLIDISRLKPISSLVGMTSDDGVMLEIGRRLNAAFRSTDTMARLGNDYFFVILENIGKCQEEAGSYANEIAERVVNLFLFDPLQNNHSKCGLGISIGLSIYPKLNDTSGSLIQEANAAMHWAKYRNSNICIFDSDMYKDMYAKYEMECEIRSALKEGRCEMWLQDQVNCKGELIGAEVLLRFRCRNGKLVQPSQFISVAESSGLIVQLGSWVLEEACALIYELNKHNFNMKLSINVSPRQFCKPTFISDVEKKIEFYGLKPGQLTLEVTENLFIKSYDELRLSMERLADMGVRISVDDFGTGYSSLLCLNQLPLHESKIDKGFVDRLPNDKASAAIVEAILTMGERLSLDVIVEGIETVEQVRFFDRYEAMSMQGYYFARPMPLSEWKCRILTHLCCAE